MKQSATESDSYYDALETRDTRWLLDAMNREDRTVPDAVATALDSLEALIESIVARFKLGGRLFYMGSGTSGRLGVVDASECPPTFGVPQGLVVGLIAGGDAAIRQAQEGAEDDAEQGWRDLQTHQPRLQDTVIGLSASGTTPYVLGALKQAKNAGLNTGCIVCNAGSPIAAAVDWPVEIIVGPEFVTGSTRLKAGTAQKLALNMISTAVMIRTGRVRGNRMVDMQLTNRKLERRGARYVAEATGLPEAEAQRWLLEHGSVRKAVEAFQAWKDSF